MLGARAAARLRGSRFVRVVALPVAAVEARAIPGRDVAARGRGLVRIDDYAAGTLFPAYGRGWRLQREGMQLWRNFQVRRSNLQRIL